MVVIFACAIIASKSLNLECWVLGADVCKHLSEGLCTGFGILSRKKINKDPAGGIVNKEKIVSGSGERWRADGTAIRMHQLERVALSAEGLRRGTRVCFEKIQTLHSGCES